MSLNYFQNGYWNEQSRKRNHRMQGRLVLIRKGCNLEASRNVSRCGDGDTAASSSGVLKAVKAMKESKLRNGQPVVPGSGPESTSKIGHDVPLRELRGKDMDIWRQEGGLPQVTKSWDDRRRTSQFAWESSDPTAEAKTIKGVFAAAVASLQESGFAVDRAVSRLREMQSAEFQREHAAKHLSQ